MGSLKPMFEYHALKVFVKMPSRVNKLILSSPNLCYKDFSSLFLVIIGKCRNYMNCHACVYELWSCLMMLSACMWTWKMICRMMMLLGNCLIVEIGCRLIYNESLFVVHKPKMVVGVGVYSIVNKRCYMNVQNWM